MRTIKIIFILLALSGLVSCKKDKGDVWVLEITYKVYDKKTGDYSFQKEVFETHGERLEVPAINCLIVGSIQRCGYSSYSYNRKY